MKQIKIKPLAWGLLLAGAALFSTPAITGGEIKDEFYRLQDQIQKGATPQEEKEALLVENIKRAIRMSLLRTYSYCDYNLVDIDASNIEQSETDPYLYYFQYQDFVGYYLFTQDPKRYLQIPADEKVYVPKTTDLVRLEDAACDTNTTNN